MGKLVLGRDKILNILNVRFNIAKDLGGVIDFIAGDAGIGKTTVIEAFKESNPDCSIVYVQCSSLTDSDDLYKPCNDALNQLYENEAEKKEESRFRKMLKKVNAEKILDVGSQILGMIPGCDLPAAVINVALSAIKKEDIDEIKQIEKYKSDRVLLYTDLFIGLSINKPLVVIFDDLHWADRGTTNVIKHIFQILLERSKSNQVPAQLMVLCSLRESEAKTDTMRNGINELFNFMNRYNKRESAYLYMKHNLLPIDDVSMGQLFSYLLDYNDNVSGELKQWVLMKSSGNPLMLETYVDVFKEFKIIELVDNLWVDFKEVSFVEGRPILRGRLLNADKKGIFKRNGSVILSSLRNVSDIELKILYAASIFTSSFTLEALGDILGLTEDEVYWSVNHLEHMDFIEMGDSFYNGVEKIVTYYIASKVLKEALYSDLSVRQSKIYEVRLAQYYEKQIDRLNTMKEIIEEIDESHLVAKDSVFSKQLALDNEKERNHKLAYFHYDRAGLAVKAIQHCLPNLEKLIELHEDAVDDKLSVSYEDTYRALVDGFNTVDQLFDRVIDELFFNDFEDKDYIFGLRVRIVTLYAKFYALNGLYSKSIKEIEDAYNIGILTEDSNDDLQILLKLNSVLYESGQYAKGRLTLEKVLKYIDDNSKDIEAEDLVEHIDTIIEYFKRDYIAMAKYSDKVISIAEEKTGFVIEYIYAGMAYVFLKHNEVDLAKEYITKAQELNKESNKRNEKLIEAIPMGLCPCIEDIMELDYMESVCEPDLLSIGNGTVDGRLVANTYHWEWRINAAKVILEAYLYEYKKNFSRYGSFIQASIIMGIWRLLNWLDLYGNTLPNLSACDDETEGTEEMEGDEENNESEEAFDEYIGKSLEEFQKQAENTHREFLAKTPLKEMVKFYLFELKNKVDIEYWWEVFDVCSNYFVESEYFKEVLTIYKELSDSEFIKNDFKAKISLVTTWGLAVSEDENLLEAYAEFVFDEMLPKITEPYQRYQFIKEVLESVEIQNSYNIVPLIDELLEYEIGNRYFGAASDIVELYEEYLSDSNFKRFNLKLEEIHNSLLGGAVEKRDDTLDDYYSENEFERLKLANLLEMDIINYDNEDELKFNINSLITEMKIANLLQNNSVAKLELLSCYREIATTIISLMNWEDELDIDEEIIENIFNEEVKFFEGLDDFLLKKYLFYMKRSIDGYKEIESYDSCYDSYEDLIEQFIVAIETIGINACDKILKPNYKNFDGLIADYMDLIKKNGDIKKGIELLFTIGYKYGELPISKEKLIPKLKRVIKDIIVECNNEAVSQYYVNYIKTYNFLSTNNH